MESVKEQSWYKPLSEEKKDVLDRILRNHDKFKQREKKYKLITYCVKIAILSLAMCSTIILGIRGHIADDFRINAGLVLSAVITFLTAIFSHFNYEKFWMRNIKAHIRHNMLRDTFINKAKANKLDEQQLEIYSDALNKIEENNIQYWEEVTRKLS